MSDVVKFPTKPKWASRVDESVAIGAPSKAVIKTAFVAAVFDRRPHSSRLISDRAAKRGPAL